MQTLIINNPAFDCSSEQIRDFVSLVGGSGQVKSDDLEFRVQAAKKLVLLYDGSTLVGTSAIKNSRKDYKYEVFHKAKVPYKGFYEADGFTYELGWLAVAKEYRGKGYSNKLRSDTLNGVCDPIFTTFLHNQIEKHSGLLRHGFYQIGHPFPSNNGKGDLVLMVRKLTDGYQQTD